MAKVYKGFKLEHGNVVIKLMKDPEWSEWIGAWYEDGKYDEDKSYFGGDSEGAKEDVIATMKTMMERYKKSHPIKEGEVIKMRTLLEMANRFLDEGEEQLYVIIDGKKWKAHYMVGGWYCNHILNDRVEGKSGPYETEEEAIEMQREKGWNGEIYFIDPETIEIDKPMVEIK